MDLLKLSKFFNKSILNKSTVPTTNPLNHHFYFWSVTPAMVLVMLNADALNLEYTPPGSNMAQTREKQSVQEDSIHPIKEICVEMAFSDFSGRRNK